MALSRGTINNYRSRLKLLRKCEPFITDPHEHELCVRNIAELELKLGDQVESPTRPGRPRRTTQVPQEVVDEVRRREVLAGIGISYSPEAVAARLKAFREANVGELAEKSDAVLDEMLKTKKEGAKDDHHTEGTHDPA